MNDTDARLRHPWLRINRVLRVMLHTRWSSEAWAQVRVEFKERLRFGARSGARGGSTRSSQTRRPNNPVPAGGAGARRDRPLFVAGRPSHFCL